MEEMGWNVRTNSAVMISMVHAHVGCGRLGWLWHTMRGLAAVNPRAETRDRMACGMHTEIKVWPGPAGCEGRTKAGRSVAVSCDPLGAQDVALVLRAFAAESRDRARAPGSNASRALLVGGRTSSCGVVSRLPDVARVVRNHRASRRWFENGRDPSGV